MSDQKSAVEVIKNIKPNIYCKGADYKKHKNDGISICEKFVQENNQLTSWTPLFQTKKKDDLADAFLQGIWYMKHRNIISYAENLNINCVTLS